MNPKRIAVIGSGASGICALKTLREEELQPVCYEKTSHIGGLWRYHDNDVEGIASVMKSTILNSSKELSAFSDFPPKEDAANYMHHTQVLKYLTDYATEFDVVKYVQFNKEVVSLDKAHDYEETGRLTVSVKDTKTQEITKTTFDGVIVCVGHHVYPSTATLPGQEKYRGKIMHTHSLKKVGEFKDQSVVVVGGGSSAMDAAVEISSVAKQVYLSTRRGAWILPRVGERGLPFDLIFTRKWLYLLSKYLLPYGLASWYTERHLNQRFDHEIYNLKPEHSVWSQQPTVSDQLPLKILSGTVLVRKNITEIVENGVVFENDDEVSECDALVLATGYQIKFPFLSEQFIKIENNVIRLYKYVFPAHLKHSSLAFAGIIQPVGAGFPLAEAQLRWAVLVMKGKLQLPSEVEMETDIQKKIDANKIFFTDSQKNTILVPYIKYLDEMNALYGAKPNIWKVLLKDPELFLSLLFGPALPYQYRLQGPHAKSDIRKVILEWEKRVIKPLKRDYKRHTYTSRKVSYVLVFILVLIMSLVIMFSLPF